MTSQDRIEKRVVLRAPQSRVWRAISDAEEFGAWFGFALEGPFVQGETIRGKVLGELDEETILEAQRSAGVEPSGIRLPEDSFTFCTVVCIEPERYFSFRWVPYSIDAEANPEDEPTTLVEFRLAPVAEGTEVTVVESGFDAVPAHRRERAFRMNQGGWAAQTHHLKRHVEGG